MCELMVNQRCVCMPVPQCFTFAWPRCAECQIHWTIKWSDFQVELLSVLMLNTEILSCVISVSLYWKIDELKGLTVSSDPRQRCPEKTWDSAVLVCTGGLFWAVSAGDLFSFILKLILILFHILLILFCFLFYFILFDILLLILFYAYFILFLIFHSVLFILYILFLFFYFDFILFS